MLKIYTRGDNITSLSKKFILFMVFLSTVFIYLLFVYPNIYKKDTLSLEISAITQLPNLSYSNSQFEPRIKEYKDFSKESFEQKVQINYMDFVYEK